MTSLKSLESLRAAKRDAGLEVYRIAQREAVRLETLLPFVRDEYDNTQRRRLARLLLESQDFLLTAAPSEPGDQYALHKFDRCHFRDVILLYDVSVRHEPTLEKYAVLFAAHVCRNDEERQNEVASAAATLGASLAELRVRAGEFLLRAQRPADAARVLELAVTHHPRRLDALERLAWAQYARNDVVAAGLSCDAAVLFAAQTDQTLSLVGKATLGEVLLHRRRWQRAAVTFEAIVACKPNQSSAQLGFALALAHLGRHEAARSAAQAALADSNDFGGMLPRLLQVCSILEDLPLLRRIHTRALDEAPKDVPMFRCMSELFLGFGDIASAASCLHHLLHHETSIPADFFDLDYLWREVDQLDCALEALQRGVKTHPQDVRLCRRLAETLLQKATSATDESPQQARARHDRILSLLQRVHQAEPTDVECGALYGEALRHAHKYLAAGDVYSTIAPHAGRAQHEMAFCAAAAYVLAQRKAARTEALLCQCIAANVHAVESRRMLGDLLCRAKPKRLEEGAALFAEAEALEARDGDAGGAANASLSTKHPSAAQAATMVPRPIIEVAYTVGAIAGKGVLLGTTNDGRPLVRDAERGLVCADALTCSSPHHCHDVLPSVPQARHFVASPALQQRLDALMQKSIHGLLRVDDLHSRVLQQGGQLLLVGGALRDCLAAAARQQALPETGDADCVSTLLPSVVSILAQRGADADPPSTRTHCFGVVQLNGGDVATVRQSGMYEPPVRVLGCRHVIWPIGFGDDLLADSSARDFCCNAVYYDPETQTILDPTGFGIGDAQARVLRVPDAGMLAKNRSWLWRYAHMRRLGFTALDSTRAYAHKAAQQHLPYDFNATPVRRAALVNDIARMCRHASGSTPQAVLDVLLQQLCEDGLEALVQRYVEPLRDELRGALAG